MYIFKRYERLCLLKVKGTMNNILKLFAVNPLQSNEGVISTLKNVEFFFQRYFHSKIEKNYYASLKKNNFKIDFFSLIFEVGNAFFKCRCNGLCFHSTCIQ